MPAMFGSALFSLFATSASACSSAIMNNSYRLSIHTMDLPSIGHHPLDLEWQLMVVPKGTRGVRSSEHGYVGFFGDVPALDPAGKIIEKQIAVGGLNDAGLSCSAQVLGGSYPKLDVFKDNIEAAEFCRWAFEGHDSVAAVKEGLKKVNFIGPFLPLHFALRDATGVSAVVEFVDAEMHVYDDLNDGVTSFGILTNDPEFPWHVENVKHLQWKQNMARPSVSMPGSWYPDERYLRLHLVKSGMPQPKSYEEAFMQAASTLNTVTVPMGQQMGTDGSGDHTQFGAIYDHKQGILYWRTELNHNFQRLRLEDAMLRPNATLNIYSEKLPWFNDVADQLGLKAGADVV